MRLSRGGLLTPRLSVILTGSRFVFTGGAAMNFSFLETVLLTTCLFLSVAALLVIFRNQRTYLSLTDLDMLRAASLPLYKGRDKGWI